MEKNIMVSIHCLVYNHEKYLRKCLEGFIMQETTFTFEILIHDDASTDKSADIIREFERKYPNIIKPIYQKENQYSKKIKIGETFQYPRVKGKYLAICEGDDSWIDSHKLQKQVDYMEKHPDCVMTCHNSIRHYCDTGKDVIENPFEHEGEVNPDEIIYHKANCWPATASIMYRYEIRKNFPDFLKYLSIGDYPLRIYCAAVGKIYYFKDVMSVYNFGTTGSWSKKITPVYSNYFSQKMINALESYNKFTNYQFDEAVKNAIFRYKYSIQRQEYRFKELSNNPYSKHSRLMFVVSKIGCFLPKTTKYLLKKWDNR